MNNTVEAQHTDTLMKEIDLVQNCISRMAQYSFIVKGWTISMVAALLALTPQKTNIKLLCIVCFVLTGCFWYLDATFLKTEKLYRRKYKWIITNRGSRNICTWTERRRRKSDNKRQQSILPDLYWKGK